MDTGAKEPRRGGGAKRQSARQLRERKQKKLYSDDWALGEDEDESMDGGRSFNLHEKLESQRFAHNAGMVREMHGHELTIAYIQRNGFNTPLLFKEKAGLGLRVPSSSFTINDVRQHVGSKRILDVMDVNTQKNSEMTMREWQKYYDDQSLRKERLLNVISLEFSHTKLEGLVRSPTIVRQLDWVDWVWPRHLKDSQVEATNLIEDMKYPKVQKYCLMSVKGCYTDFHVDFGGTSVWYHILRGSKVFWLIPPTEHNLELYERWVLSGKQSDIFFGDSVDKCARIELKQGNTFFIPTGWIHAVYTPQDALVFGGNFLHSFGIDKQLKIAQVEEYTKVPQKFRYPFFTEMLWYVLERYVDCLLGETHLVNSENRPKSAIQRQPHVHLTYCELHGLKEIVMYLHLLPSNKKNVPELLRDPVGVIESVRTLIGLHRQDSSELAITGRTILSVPMFYNNNNTQQQQPQISDPVKPEVAQEQASATIQLQQQQQQPEVKTEVAAIATQPGQQLPAQSSGSIVSYATATTSPSDVSDAGSHAAAVSAAAAAEAAAAEKGGPRRRRTRCKKCEACRRSDCGECSFCLDMVKFGGPGRAKQTCNMRQCLQPMLPVTAICAHCELDGWGQAPAVGPPQKERTQNSTTPRPCNSALMECSVCYEIAHPGCAQRLADNGTNGYTGYINEDMPNSWECPLCCRLGKNSDYRPRHFRARQKSSDIRRMSVSSSDTGSIGGSTVAVGSTLWALQQQQLLQQQQQQQQQQLQQRPLPENVDASSDASTDSYCNHETTTTTTTTKINTTDNNTTTTMLSASADNSNSSTLTNQSHQSQHTILDLDQHQLQQKQLILKQQQQQQQEQTTAADAGMAMAISGIPLKKRRSNDCCNIPPEAGIHVKCPVLPSSISTPMTQTATPLTHLSNNSESSKRQAQRLQLAHQIVQGSTRVLKKASVVVRPCVTITTQMSGQVTNNEVITGTGTTTTTVATSTSGSHQHTHLSLDKRCLLPIFSHLTPAELYRCSLVCKCWAQLSVHPSLWTRMTFAHCHLTPDHLRGIVRRQPETLLLDWCTVNKYQLPWLVQRIPALRHLSLVSVPVKSVVAVRGCNYSALRSLDLSFVAGFNDAALRDIIGPNAANSARHVFTDEQRNVRLRHLHTLNLSGTDITDIALRYVTQYLPSLHTLSLGSCARISDAGVAQLTTKPASTLTLLQALDLSHAKLVTEQALEHLARCERLTRLDMRHAAQVSTQALIRFAARSAHDLQVRDVKLVDRRQHKPAQPSKTIDT